MASTELAERLGDKRREVLAVTQRSDDRDNDYPVVVVYDYTDDLVHEVAVDVDSRTVRNVTTGQSMPALSSREEQRAIELVRTDGRLAERGIDVSTGSGIIIEETNFHDPAHGHRLVDLRFGPEDTRYPTAYAIVDLSAEHGSGRRHPAGGVMSQSGTVSWPPGAPVWSFSWDITDGNTEAIAFRNVFFKGIKVLHKASLPMIRVQYDSGNGPYKDQLSSFNMQGPVKVYEGSPGAGYRFLVVESYHTIGRYRLLNRWIFRSDGIILPQMYSAGLQHPSNHRHHCYWRFDFDIDGASNNLALQHALTGTDWGYGPGGARSHARSRRSTSGTTSGRCCAKAPAGVTRSTAGSSTGPATGSAGSTSPSPPITARRTCAARSMRRGTTRSPATSTARTSTGRT